MLSLRVAPNGCADPRVCLGPGPVQCPRHRWVVSGADHALLLATQDPGTDGQARLRRDVDGEKSGGLRADPC